MIQTKHLTGLALVLAITACGGDSTSAPTPPVVSLPPSNPAPTPAPPPTPPPTTADFQSIIDAIEASSDPNFAVIIGDQTGILFEYEKGSFRVEDNVPIASASKWLTGATLMRLVENGVMNLSDTPQDFLPYWTSDPADARSQITLAQLLSFQSGFNASPIVNSCVTDGSTTLQACAEQIYDFDIATAPGTAYAYGPHHMQIAAAMAERATGLSFNSIFRDNLANIVGMSQATTYQSPSTSNPRASGGVVSNGRDYALFLQSLLDGSLITDRDSFLEDRTDNVTILFRPTETEDNGDWHYALGSWLECDDTPFSQSCANEQIQSSPGAFGWTPWIDFQNDYYAIVARRGTFGSTAVGVELEQTLQPLINQALSQ